MTEFLLGMRIVLTDNILKCLMLILLADLRGVQSSRPLRFKFILEVSHTLATLKIVAYLLLIVQ